MAVYRTLKGKDGIPQSLQEQSFSSGDDTIFTNKELEGIDAIVGEVLSHDSDDEVL